MWKALHARLTLALLGLLVLVAALSIFSTLATTRLYFQEVNQSLNLDLATNIADMKAEHLLDERGRLRTGGLDGLFHWLMVVNPDLELYLLDRRGDIVAYDAAPGAVVRDRVDLEPIKSFLASRDRMPIRGDDPRDLNRRKIFSAAALPATGSTQGYLYVVLASEELESAVERLRGSYILRLSTWWSIGILVLASLFGLLLFARLTRPLRHLAARMRAFQDEDPESDPPPPADDEVTSLGLAFDQLTERVRKQMGEIERMSGLRRELIANVSHDLRTPIATLQGYLETLSLKGDALPVAERERYLQIALGQSERLGRLVGELFELTKLEHAEVTLEPETFCLAELVHDNLQGFQLEAQEKGVALRADIARGRTYVEADIGMIERALENLIGNAVRYTTIGGSVTVAVCDGGPGGSLDGRIVVSVADTGRGIDPGDLPHIFDRRFRCSFPNRSHHASDGAGLGLAITQRIVELHGGAIDVDSTVGVGTSFRFGLTASAFGVDAA